MPTLLVLVGLRLAAVSPVAPTVALPVAAARVAVVAVGAILLRTLGASAVERVQAAAAAGAVAALLATALSLAALERALVAARLALRALVGPGPAGVLSTPAARTAAGTSLTPLAGAPLCAGAPLLLVCAGAPGAPYASP